MNRFASRYNHRDRNEAEILKALDQLGVEYWIAGPLDFWIWLGQWVPVEVKMPKGKLTAGQKDFISRANLSERPYRLWRTPLEAIESVQLWRKTQPQITTTKVIKRYVSELPKTLRVPRDDWMAG